jgi:hypothetical protein
MDPALRRRFLLPIVGVLWLALVAAIEVRSLHAARAGQDAPPSPAEIKAADASLDSAQLARELDALRRSGGISDGGTSRAPMPAALREELKGCAAEVRASMASQPPADDAPLNDEALQDAHCQYEILLNRARDEAIAARRRRMVVWRILGLGALPSAMVLVARAALSGTRVQRSKD